MRAKVLLVDPTSVAGQSYEDSDAELPGPNMGLIMLATYLKHNDVSVQIVDMGAQHFTEQHLLDTIRDSKPDIVGFSAKTFNVTAVYRLAEAIKMQYPNGGAPKVVLGGSHAQALPEKTLQECSHLDAVFHGDGEVSLLQMVNQFPNVAGVSGISYRYGKGILRGPEIEIIRDMDSIPDADFSFVDYSLYAGRPNSSTGKYEVRYPIFHARGCPFNCSFCMSPRNYRMRSTERVIDEIERLHTTTGMDYIFFEDSTFLPKRADFENFCKAYIERGMHKRVGWGFGTRIDVAFPGIFQVAKEAGCIQVGFGIESGSEKVLNHNNKNLTKSDIRRVVGEAAEVGIGSIRGFFIIGLPYDTRETIEETAQLIEELPMTAFGLGVLDVYPGTEAWNLTEKGKAGLTWLPGRRLNWDSYSRHKAQTSINGIGEAELNDLRAKIDKRGRIARNKRKTTAEQLVNKVKYTPSRGTSWLRRLLGR